jgi:hypothetical protein
MLAWIVLRVDAIKQVADYGFFISRGNQDGETALRRGGRERCHFPRKARKGDAQKKEAVDAEQNSQDSA